MAIDDSGAGSSGANVGARRHFLPANSIGYFSSVQSGDARRGRRARRRNHVVWVFRRGHSAPREDIPDNLANSRTVYHAGRGPTFDVDEYFKRFEAMNDTAVTSILMNPAGGKQFNTWVRLAAYVASRIARNPDAEFRMESDEAFPWPQERRGVGYVMGMQRLSAAVLRTRWSFLISNDEDFIINDRGFVGLINPVWGKPALLVPLRRRAAVILGDGPFAKKVEWTDSKWCIDIPSYTLSSEQVAVCNALSWVSAREEAYGSSREVLVSAASRHSSVPEAVMSLARGDAMFSILGGSVREHVRDELLLNKVLGGLTPPGAVNPQKLWSV